MSAYRHPPKIHFSFRLTLISVFIGLTILTAAVAVSLQFYFGRQMATEQALTRFEALNAQSNQYLDGLDKSASQAAELLAKMPGLIDGNRASAQARQLFASIMDSNTLFYAIYLGFPNGDFHELINLDSSPIVRDQLRAKSSDRWVVIDISGEEAARRRRYQYYDSDFRLRVSREEPSDYRANQRPWYLQAGTERVSKTAPYLFHNLQAPGQTYSRKLVASEAVIAVDIALSSLSEYFAGQISSPGQEIFLYQPNGELIASSSVTEAGEVLPPVAKLKLSEAEKAVIAAEPLLTVANELDWAPIDFAVAGEPRGYAVEYLSLIAQMTGLSFTFSNGFSWLELVDHFNGGDIDILQPVFLTRSSAELGLFSAPFVQAPYALASRPGEKILRHIRDIAGLRLAIPAGWSIIETIATHFPEIDIVEVGNNREALVAVRDGEADAALDASAILHYVARQFRIDGLQYHENISFSPINVPDQLHLVVKPEKAALLKIINRAIAAMGRQQQRALERRWFGRRSDKTEASGVVPYKELVDIAATAQLQGKLQRIEIGDRELFVYVAPVARESHRQEFFATLIPVDEVLAPFLQRVYFSIALTGLFLLVLSPVPWLFASPIVRPIRALAEENEKIKRREFTTVNAPTSRIREIHELGRSMLTMSESIARHEWEQRNLMDSFIQLIAGAIDEKSPYTAAHCERVPELALMLAEKAIQSSDPAFCDFSFQNEDEWREFRIGAWLHDCGKITTPVHIVDKGAKLETIYNRIHEIRTRFEVLLRDAEISYWQDMAAAPESEAEHRSRLVSRQQQIRDDFAFVAQMNIGGESLSEQDKQRLHQIADIHWQRNLSNRLGLSPVEECDLQGEDILPVEECLLSDRPEQRIARHRSVDYEAHLGINMAVPELLYNQGELYNLLVERGTLTEEDRFKISEHMISTIRMLDKLPFPPELARVPQYASTHHERLDGRGYPRGLRAEQLSIPERIMVLADIFEALTAHDRPYKKAKSLSESMDILAAMVRDQHVDFEVFSLFLRSGVYLEYARRFLQPEQIDEVDVEYFLQDAVACKV